MDTILTVWLKNPPSEAVLFTRLALVEVLINSVSLPITTAARAPGKMKLYESTLGAIQIGIFFASWAVLLMGYEAYSVFIVAIIANLIMFVLRLFIVSLLIKLPVQDFIREVVYPVIFIIIVSSLLSYTIHFILPKSFVYICLTIVTSAVISIISMYYGGFNKPERVTMKNIIITYLRKISIK